MALTTKDFEVGDYVQLIKDNRRGHVRFIGRIQSIGKIIIFDLFRFCKVCIGVECDKEIPNGHDGTFKGTKYFTCPPGKGIFVVPDKIRSIVKRVKASPSRGRAEQAKSPTRSESTKGQKTKVTETKTTQRTATSVPRKSIGTTSKANEANKNKGKPFEIPKDMTTPKQMIDYMLGLLPDKSTLDKQRLQIFDKLSHLIASTDPPLSSEDAQYVITQFKTSMPILVLFFFFFFLKLNLFNNNNNNNNTKNV
ncbi:hypothetical protein RFI_28720 [Reticulomyxa filosa]|uniref:CAP-Gly domain-containing protein n=1 Tax=Reticulomyxa filosa TaxID=46433 RepID=X6M6L2_RETFI|nr:hypothetical protein RFI_28720 [Reticulomyxa filosa]|eukprot:ETO08665.1 hypothetical protein RFI_28720 [Reticulomyxa filosa]